MADNEWAAETTPAAVPDHTRGAVEWWFNAAGSGLMAAVFWVILAPVMLAVVPGIGRWGDAFGAAALPAMVFWAWMFSSACAADRSSAIRPSSVRAFDRGYRLGKSDAMEAAVFAAVRQVGDNEFKAKLAARRASARDAVRHDAARHDAMYHDGGANA